MPIDSLPVSPNQVDSDAMRTKINELISDNSSVTVGDTPPTSPGEGDLWFDEGAASMYVYVASPTNAWIQTNPSGGAGGSIGVATTSEDGLMSSGDKTKLDEIPTGGGGGGIQAKVRIPRTTVNSWDAPQSFDSSFNVSKVTGLSGYYTVYFINPVVDPVFAWSLSEASKTVVIKSIAGDGLSFNFEIWNTPSNPSQRTAHLQPAYIIVA
jgi:hypothetical protein